LIIDLHQVLHFSAIS